MSNFDEIRPYNDSEVNAVINRLSNDSEFISTVAHYRLNNWPKVARRTVGRWLVKKHLSKYLESISDVKSFQMTVKDFMDQMIEQTISELTVEGLDQLPEGPCLFISNHRDIAMDPALVNWTLHNHGHETVRIAIGDNLLSKPWTSDLMRLNKSFIVQRSIKAPRKLFAAFKTLSSYISHSLKVDGEHVWIAQREGRAKDGNDLTEPAIIKMFAMAKSKEQTLAQFINSINLVPVSISYEYDPCDQLKAHELSQIATHGSYKKSAHEDIQTIGRGITGHKGRVNVSFAKPIANLDDDVTAEQIAELIDTAILDHYKIRPANIIAMQQLDPEADIDASDFGISFSEMGKASAEFRERFEGIEPSDEEAFLGAYAAPVKRLLERKTAR